MKKFILSLFAFAAFTVAQAQEETEKSGLSRRIARHPERITIALKRLRPERIGPVVE